MRSDRRTDIQYIIDWNKDIALTEDETEAVEVHERCIRAINLLKACRDLLATQNETIYVLNMLETEVEYDGSRCEGATLLEDIEDLLLEANVIDEEM